MRDVSGSEEGAPSLTLCHPTTITKAEARRHLPVGPTKLNSLIREGQIATIRVGTRRFVLWDSLQKFIAEAQAEATKS
jgi:hypothetical protein